MRCRNSRASKPFIKWEPKGTLSLPLGAPQTKMLLQGQFLYNGFKGANLTLDAKRPADP
jgi:hypothetical protein